jgi:hypothetical protein
MLTKSGQLIMLEAKIKPSCTACWAHNHGYYLTNPAYCMLSTVYHRIVLSAYSIRTEMSRFFKNTFASFSPISPRYLALKSITFVPFLFNKRSLRV